MSVASQWLMIAVVVAVVCLAMAWRQRLAPAVFALGLGWLAWLTIPRAGGHHYLWGEPFILGAVILTVAGAAALATRVALSAQVAAPLGRWVERRRDRERLRQARRHDGRCERCGHRPPADRGARAACQHCGLSPRGAAARHRLRGALHATSLASFVLFAGLFIWSMAAPRMLLWSDLRRAGPATRVRQRGLILAQGELALFHGQTEFRPAPGGSPDAVESLLRRGGRPFTSAGYSGGIDLAFGTGARPLNVLGVRYADGTLRRVVTAPRAAPPLRGATLTSRDRGLALPLWLLAPLAAAYPAWRRLTRPGRRKAAPTGSPSLNRCLCCGYDLRAGHERCPECGEPVAGEPAEVHAANVGAVD